MRTDRPKGWLPHTPGSLPEYETRFGIDTPKPFSLSLRLPWTDLIQVGQSCVWNGAACGEYAFTGEKNSPYTGYWAGRAKRHPDIAQDPHGYMPDEGLSVVEIVDSYENSGTCQMNLWSPSTPNFSIHKRPPGPARVDSQRHNFNVSVISATGDALFAALACACDRKDFALLALDVDEEFEDFSGDGIIGPQSGPSLGGHLIPMWKHDFAEGEALIGNYWPHWGMGNLARISAGRIAQARHGFIIHRRPT